MGKIDGLIAASALVVGTYLTIHGFTKDSTLPTEITGITMMLTAATIQRLIYRSKEHEDSAAFYSDRLWEAFPLIHLAEELEFE